METVENILLGMKIPSPITTVFQVFTQSHTKSYYNFFKIIQFCIMSFLLFRMKSNAVFQLIS